MTALLCIIAICCGVLLACAYVFGLYMRVFIELWRLVYGYSIKFYMAMRSYFHSWLFGGR